MPIEVLDPTYDEDPIDVAPAPRLDTLAGATVGIISNGKQNTEPFFDAVEAELRARYGVGDVVRVTKDSYSAPAGADVMDRAKQWHALVAGVGD